jgi:hypothetical protein
MTKTTESNTATTKTAPEQRRLALMSLEELAAKPPALNWLVDGVAVKGQPLVVGGPTKTLKTSLALDLAVSLATRTPFLGRFPVPRRRRVAVFSGESGKATIYETLTRILEAREEAVESRDLLCGFRLPKLSRPADRAELRKLLKAEGVEVVVIDPLYRCLLGDRKLSGANLYDVGTALGETADACADAGATLVLVHHTIKAAAKAGTATLTDLAFAGVAEFARQWLLVNRASEYRPGSGVYDLVLSVGGSAGHSSRWRVGVEEGTGGPGKRDWKVKVSAASGAVREAAFGYEDKLSEIDRV